MTLGVWCAGKSVCVPVARMGGHLVSMPGVGIHPHSHKWESTSISTDAYIGRKCSHRSIAQYWCRVRLLSTWLCDECVSIIPAFVPVLFTFIYCVCVSCVHFMGSVWWSGGGGIELFRSECVQDMMLLWCIRHSCGDSGFMHRSLCACLLRVWVATW